MSARDPQGSTPAEGRDPTDTPLLAVLRRYEADGFSDQFNAREGALIHCYTCGNDMAAEDCRHGPVRRLEGASDPSDMLAIIPVRCPECGARGVVIANFGPEATIADAEVLVALDRAPPATGSAGPSGKAVG